MYIKLTRLDNSPIWINASFVVTVEPRRGGGSVVVPIGDGLDYDVRETPESVLAMLAGAPAPEVVPVPAPKGLAPTPEDVSPEPELPAPEAPAAEPVAPFAGSVAPAAKPEAPAAEPGAPLAGLVAPSAAAEKPARKTTRTRAKAKAETPAAESAEPGAAAKPAKKPRTARKPKLPELTLTDAQVERLKKMAPGSVRKLQNTLVTQFKTEKPDEVIQALEARQVVTLDRDHVVWAH